MVVDVVRRGNTINSASKFVENVLLHMAAVFTSSHRVRLLSPPRYFPGTLLAEATKRYAREFAALVGARSPSSEYTTSLPYLKARPTWKSPKTPL